MKKMVAVLPKKEWFIYCYFRIRLQKRKSQSYPKRSGSSISIFIGCKTHRVAVLPKKEWFIYRSLSRLNIKTVVAVLPKKEWFIYVYHRSKDVSTVVAVLPKKEWFIYDDLGNQYLQR